MELISIDKLQCLCSDNKCNSKIAYILYPIEGYLDKWIDQAAKNYGTTIVVITGMNWENVFSPWPAKGVPAGSPDFKGESPEFLKKLQTAVIPEIESRIGCHANPDRSLIGISMSGLFALWQWLLCDTFTNIASLSGSFWYDGFIDWFDKQQISDKSGLAFFLLGNQESKSRVKAFQAVGSATETIVERLKNDGIKVKFMSVPGNHYSNPVPRLEAAFSALYCGEEL